MVIASAIVSICYEYVFGVLGGGFSGSARVPGWHKILWKNYAPNVSIGHIPNGAHSGKASKGL
jgi:hypothetical protein